MSKMYNKDNIPRARALRKNMTLPERTLWYHYLRDLPVRFYRQKLIDNYIVDFYCPKLKLVIELDGGQHYQDKNMAYDQHRTETLERYGLKVIRFTDTDILCRFENVCEYLDKIVNGS